MKILKEDIGTKIKILKETHDGYKFAQYKPKANELFYQNWYPFRKNIKQVIRFLLEHIQAHYTVYYLADADMNLIGLCVAEPCGFGRYSVIERPSFMIGPYVIKEEYRGCGLAVKMIENVLEQLPVNIPVYDWISRRNIASIVTTERVGGVPVNGMTLNPYTRRFKLGDIDYGDYLLYRIER